MEKYLQILEFPNYEVSNLGNVRNIKTRRILKTQISKRGKYSQLNLSKYGKTYAVKVHRLVATTHLDNPNNYLEIDHKDRNKLNNNSSNLRWVTSRVNQENSLSSNPYITFNNLTNKYLVYIPLLQQYSEYELIEEAISKFLDHLES